MKGFAGTVPGQNAAELLPEMRARHAGAAAIAWQELMSYLALGGAGDSALERLCCALAGGPRPAEVAFGTGPACSRRAGSRAWSGNPAT